MATFKIEDTAGAGYGVLFLLNGNATLASPGSDTATLITLNSLGNVVGTFDDTQITLVGTGFTFDAGGLVTGGTITSIEQRRAGALLASVTGLSFAAIDAFDPDGTLKQGLNDTVAHTIAAQVLGGDDVVIGSSLKNFIETQGGNDTVFAVGGDTIDGGAGVDTLDYSTAAKGVTLALGLNGANGLARVGDILSGKSDSIAGFENVVGSGFADAIAGNELANRLQGGLGADTLVGGLGDDTLVGGDGGDSLDGGVGVNTLSYEGASGNVYVNLGLGVAGAVPLTSTAIPSDARGDTIKNFTNVVGSEGTDLFYGTGVANRLEGRGGVDVLYGLAGDDTLSGGDGDDTLIGGVGADSMNGGDDFDTVSYGQAAKVATGRTGVSLDLSSGGFYGEAAGDSYGSIEHVVGSGFDDFISGNSGANRLEGGVGADELLGNSGADTLLGGDGNDTLDGGTGADSLDGGAGANTLSYRFSSAAVSADLSTSTFSGGDAAGDAATGIQNLIGSDLGDVLSGGAAANKIEGGLGNDTVYADKGGADSLYGGRAGADAGIDTLSYEHWAPDAQGHGVRVGLDPLTPGLTQAKYPADLAASIPANDLNRQLYLKISSDTALKVIDGHGAIFDPADQISGFENLIGSAGGDWVVGSALANVIEGRDGADVLWGGAGDDTLLGGSEADRLEGGSGDDSLVGGSGDDTISGGSGVDSLDGGDGIDTLNFNIPTKGTSTINGVAVDLAAQTGSVGDAAGDVILHFENVETSDFSDSIAGDEGANVLGAILNPGSINSAAPGTSSAPAAPNNDTLLGRGGDDSLVGGGGSDSLVAGAGHDTLNGGAGADVLVGNDDGDVVSYQDSFASVVVDLSDGASSTGQSARGGTADGRSGANTVHDTISGFSGVLGSGQSDSIHGSQGDNLLVGNGGRDTLDGGLGSDTLIGGSRNSPYEGGGGADLVLAGAAAGDGADSLVGSDGLEDAPGKTPANGWVNRQLDTVSYASSFAGVTVDLVAGTGQGGSAQGDTLRGFENVVGSSFGDGIRADLHDVFTDLAPANLPQLLARIQNKDSNKLEGRAGDDTLEGGAGADTLDGGADIDFASYTHSTSGVSVSLATLTGTVGDAKGDKLISIEGILGSAGNDTLIGSSAPGAAGDNSIFGGDGADSISGGSGNDFLDGGFLGFANGPDTVSGDAGDDFIAGSSSGDSLLGGIGADTISGGGGDDMIVGGAGADELHGDAGLDTVSYAASPKAAGPLATGVSVDLGTGAASGVDAAGDTFDSIEGVIGSAFDDTLVGDGQANLFFGGAGRDTIAGGQGNDTIEGNEGNDTLRGGDGVDTLSYRNSATGVVLVMDNATTSSTDGLAIGGAATGIDIVGGFENAVGSNAATGNDQILGTAGANLIEGLAGHDGLDGRAGADTLLGGLGNDTLTGGQGGDSLDGGDGLDTVSYASSAALFGVQVDLGLSALGQLAYGISSASTDADGDTLAGFENAVGTKFGDRLWGNAGANSLQGGEGNDTVEGGAGADSLDGGTGTNTLSYFTASAAGEGVVVNLGLNTASKGHAQGDKIANFQHLSGSSLADNLAGSSLANSLSGGSGDDTLDGQAGADTVFGGAGNDSILGGIDGDSVSGGTDDDTVYGQQGADWIVGDNGNDSLNAGYAGIADADVVYGGQGNDTISGGLGADFLDGGTELDVVDYSTSQGGVLVNLNGDPNDNGRQSATGFGAQAAKSDAVGDTLYGFDGVIGSSLADSLVGNADDNVLSGGGGADSLAGGGGRDAASYVGASAGVSVDLGITIQTGAGDPMGDQLFGIEDLIGSRFGDTLTGDGTANRIAGGFGNDVLYTIRSTAVGGGLGGADSLFGGEGNDTAYGGQGAESINGEGGDDSVIGSLGADTMDGLNGTDTLSYAGSAGGVEIDLDAGPNQQLAQGYGVNAALSWAEGDVVRGFDNVVGTAYADRITGNDDANRLFGGANPIYVDPVTNGSVFRADTLDGGGGNDVLDGGANADLLLGGAGNDTLLGGAGSDSVYDFVTNAYTLFYDTLEGGTGNDSLDGGADADSLSGGDDNDTILGGAGGDTIEGGTGYDSLDGGTSGYSYPGYTSNGVTYPGYSYQDTDIVSYAHSNGGVVVDLVAGIAKNLTPALGDATTLVNGKFVNDVIRNFEGVEGSDFADSILGSATDNHLVGGDGADTIVGGAGNDSIGGGAGADSLVGGTGIDVLNYETSSAGVTVKLGDTTTLAGFQYVSGGDAAGDHVTGFEGAYGSAFADSLVGSDLFASKLYGALGDDTLVGGLRNDSLDGGGGADSMFGGAGNDSLFWYGTGEVTMEGGAGADTLTAYLSGYGGTGPTLSYASSAAGVKIDLTTVYDPVTYQGRQSVGGLVAGTSDANGDVVNGFENAIGSASADSIKGSGLYNVVDGGGGNDTLDGGGGGDTLSGGSGSDTFVFSASFGQDVVNDFKANGDADTLTLQNAVFGGGVDFAGFLAGDVSQDGADTVIDDHAGNTIRLLNVDHATLVQTDFHFV